MTSDKVNLLLIYVKPKVIVNDFRVSFEESVTKW